MQRIKSGKPLVPRSATRSSDPALVLDGSQEYEKRGRFFVKNDAMQKSLTDASSSRPFPGDSPLNGSSHDDFQDTVLRELRSVRIHVTHLHSKLRDDIRRDFAAVYERAPLGRWNCGMSDPNCEASKSLDATTDEQALRHAASSSGSFSGTGSCSAQAGSCGAQVGLPSANPGTDTRIPESKVQTAEAWVTEEDSSTFAPDDDSQRLQFQVPGQVDDQEPVPPLGLPQELPPQQEPMSSKDVTKMDSFFVDTASIQRVNPQRSVSFPLEPSCSDASMGTLDCVRSRNPKEHGVRSMRLTIGRERAKAERKRMRSAHKPILDMNIAELIKSPAFDNVVGVSILINAGIIGAQTNYNATHQTDFVPWSFWVFEQFFCIWFSLELALRMYVYRWSFFKPCTDGWQWNYFDTMVVAAQLTEVVFDVLARSITMDLGKLRLLRILRILRLVRILRVVRVLHLISELRAIVSSIYGSFRSLLWVVVLLLLMIYIVAVFFTQSVTDHIVEVKVDDANWVPNADQVTLIVCFGSVMRAVLSLWQAISGGIDWDALVVPLLEQVSVISGLTFTAYVVFAILALLNVVTGVFVQTALQSARNEEDSFMSAQIVQLFRIADTDGSATIGLEEINESLEDPVMLKEWKSIGVDAEDALYLFNILDLDGNGYVTFDEFLGGCLRLSGGAKAIDVLTVMQESRSNHSLVDLKLTELQNDLHDLTRHVLDSQPNAPNDPPAAAQIHTVNDGVSKSDIAHLHRTVTQNQNECRQLLLSMGSICADIKTTMAPLGMLEAIMTETPLPNTELS